MSSLLFEKFISVQTHFLPNTASDVFSLHLAQKLGEPKAASHYQQLTEAYSRGRLILAYRGALQNWHPDLGRGFHKELEQLQSNGYQERPIKLLAIRIERRTVAAAVFNGEQLDYTDSRQLSSDNDRALNSAVGFVRWLMQRFPVKSVALGAVPPGRSQRRTLHDGVIQVLRAEGLSVWEIPQSALLSGFAHPPLRSRAELRQVATSIWPVLSGTHAKLFIQDAALLGLHVQIERQFIIN